jgi:hypothetical protein
VWLPSYAVPEADVLARGWPRPRFRMPRRIPWRSAEPPILDPEHVVCGAYGRREVHDGGDRRKAAEHAAFRPSDPDLDGYVVLDFDAFRWLEEDELIIGHPRDPYSRVDVRSSSGRVRWSTTA